MSLVSTLVYLSQALRQLSNKVRNKAITAINERIKDVEMEQVSVEEQRSANMVELHNHFYSEQDKAVLAYEATVSKAAEDYDAAIAKANKDLAEHRKIIATSSASASNMLKSELVALRTELDHLTR